jgi:hypothetical protein
VEFEEVHVNLYYPYSTIPTWDIDSPMRLMTSTLGTGRNIISSSHNNGAVEGSGVSLSKSIYTGPIEDNNTYNVPLASVWSMGDVLNVYPAWPRTSHGGDWVSKAPFCKRRPICLPLSVSKPYTVTIIFLGENLLLEMMDIIYYYKYIR